MKKLFGLIILICLSPVWLLAHGIEINASQHPPCVIVEATYEAGGMVADATFEIYYQDSTTAFQLGRTDRKGRLAFVPDKKGKWLITVDDNLGHRGKHKLEIGEMFFKGYVEVKKKSPLESFLQRAGLVVVGIFFILLLTVVFYRLKKRHET